MVHSLYDDLIGKPYKEGARGPEAYDCWGVVMAIYHRLGWPVKNYPISFAVADGRHMDRFIDTEQTRWEKHAQPVPGAVVLFRRANGLYCHVGVVIDDKRFIHSEEDVGVCIDTLNRWDPFVAGYYTPGKEALP